MLDVFKGVGLPPLRHEQTALPPVLGFNVANT